MKKIFASLLLCLLSSLCLLAQEVYNGNHYRKEVSPTRNLILMIPDGTSIGVVSAARWYQLYNYPEKTSLAIDPYICGTVKTHSSNAPIGDSAPTGSAYSTGMLQQTGNISIYPPVDSENDLVAIDSVMTWQPLTTLLEAARREKRKATGLVVTVEFPHATPASCSAHYPDRNCYERIASQMVYQNLDVMLGGGVDLVTDDFKQHFLHTGVSYYANDINSFRRHREGKLWALWCDCEMPYALDRDTTKIPSLQEMTEKAIGLLSQHPEGFFLMVEGSQIDWAAHANDAVACITEYLAFDKAVEAALRFAHEDGNTTVVIMPDHGNSGFTLGRCDLEAYDKAGIDMLFANVSRYTKTAKGLEHILVNESPANFPTIIKQHTGIDITDRELAELIESENYQPKNYMKVSDGKNMIAKLVDIMNRHTYFGFTTGGHTGEEVFLAVYHPQGDIPVGMNTNLEMNHYLADVIGLEKRLPEVTKEIFAKHTEVFHDMKYTIDRSTDSGFPTLIVKKGRKTLRIPAYQSVAYLNKQSVELGSVVVYIPQTDLFYLPTTLSQLLQ